MTPHCIAIGPFSDDESRALLDELTAPHFPDFDAVDAPEGITAIAFKGHAPFGGAQMDRFPDLGLIANFGVGYDAIDVNAAQARGIAVTNTPDVLNDDVADLALALTLAQFRRLAEGDRWVRSGQWKDGAMPLARQMSGCKVGILGLGRVGREIADRFAAFKCPVHYWSRAPKDTPGWTHHATPQALAQAVDILVIAVVGGDDTKHIVDAQVLEALGQGGVLVNVARGSCVDEAALLSALEQQTIAGAALDVFEHEPILDTRFAQLETAALYPHGGSATAETRAAMARLQRDNIRAFLQGAPLRTPVTG